MYGLLGSDPRMMAMMQQQRRMQSHNPGGLPADDPEALDVPMGPQMRPSQGLDRFPRMGKPVRSPYPTAAGPQQTMPTQDPRMNAMMQAERQKQMMMMGGAGGGYGQGAFGAGGYINPNMGFPMLGMGLR